MHDEHRDGQPADQGGHDVIVRKGGSHLFFLSVPLFPRHCVPEPCSGQKLGSAGFISRLLASAVPLLLT
jgi:hypothetical protein